jgi:hypothetical protein
MMRWQSAGWPPVMLLQFRRPGLRAGRPLDRHRRQKRGSRVGEQQRHQTSGRHHRRIVIPRPFRALPIPRRAAGDGLEPPWAEPTVLQSALSLAMTPGGGENRGGYPPSSPVLGAWLRPFPI